MFSRFFQPKGVVSVKGPNFNSAQLITFDIDGIQIRFLAPKHGGVDAIYKQEPFLERANLNEVNTSSPNTENGWPHYLRVGVRDWGFKGPYFLGTLGQIGFSVVVTKLKPETEHFSLLSEGVFERVLKERLTQKYANDIEMGHPQMIAPMNWKRHLQPLPAVSFDAMYNPRSVISAQQLKTSEYVVALSDNAYLSFFMGYSVSGDNHYSVDMAGMKALVEAVFNSIQINLSPARYDSAQQAAFKQAAGNMPAQCPPLKWITPEQEVYANACQLFDKASSLRDLLEYGSPEWDELDKYMESIAIESQFDGRGDETFNYYLPPDCPTELPAFLLKAMEKHGIHTDQDYVDYLIDQRYRMKNNKPLLRPLTAARHLVEKSNMLAASY